MNFAVIKNWFMFGMETTYSPRKGSYEILLSIASAAKLYKNEWEVKKEKLQGAHPTDFGDKFA